MSKSELQIVCEEKGITIYSEHICLEWRDKYPTDKWNCTVYYKSKSESFDFYTGISLRVLKDGVKKEGNERWYDKTTGTTSHGYKQVIERGLLRLVHSSNGKIVEPDVADVVQGVISCTDACSMAFSEWCSEFCYDDDRISSMKIYFENQTKGLKIKKLLGSSLVEELKNKEH